MKRRRNPPAKTRANRKRAIETESYFAAMETTRPRYTPARRKNRHPIKVRKNFVFLLPLAIPLVLGGVSIAALLTLKKKAESIVSLPAVLGAGVGYVAARAYKQAVPIQVAAMAIGYAGGMLLSNATKSKEQKAAEAQYEAEFSYFKPWTWYAA